MSKVLKYHFYLKDKASDCPTPINFVFNKGQFRYKKGIGESISPTWWDSKTEKAIVDSRQTKNERALSKRVNRKLDRIKVELNELFDDYNAVDKLTPNHTDGDDVLFDLSQKASIIVDDSIQEEKQESKDSYITPTEFFEQFIERWSKKANRRTGRTPQKGTIWNYQNTFRRYKDYIRENGIRDSFRLFDNSFIDLFDEYLQEEQGLCRNTLNCTHSQLKTMLNAAYEKGLIKDSSFRHWPSKPIPLQHVYLDDNEIKRIYNLVLDDKIKQENKVGKQSRIEESRDLFVISCRTGLRYSDLRHLYKERWDIDNKMLTTNIVKTQEEISIPLHDEVITIYNKYKGNLPSVIDKAHYNKHIRLCAKMAGIKQPITIFEWEKSKRVLITHPKWELLSSHTGRRSFATNLYLVCKSSQYVMSITGHKTEENFRRYICVNQKEMAEFVKEYINLNKVELKPNAELIQEIKENAVDSFKKQQQIEVLQKEKDSQKQMTSIAEFDAQVKTLLLNSLIETWQSGISYDDYERIKNEANNAFD